MTKEEFLKGCDEAWEALINTNRETSYSDFTVMLIELSQQVFDDDQNWWKKQ